MKVSKEIIELAEKIKKYRTDVKLVEELKIKNEVLEKQVKRLEKNVIILKSDTIEKNELRERIKELKTYEKNLKSDLEESRKEYDFVVTPPSEGLNTVYGETNAILSEAQQEILISSPWITILKYNFENFKNKKINIKVITRFTEEDIKFTDPEIFRHLRNLGAEIKYNNNLHAKMIIGDNSVAIISSANLTKNGLHINYEAGIVLKNKKKVNKVTQFFKEMWEKSKPLTEQDLNVLSNRK